MILNSPVTWLWPHLICTWLPAGNVTNLLYFAFKVYDYAMLLKLKLSKKGEIRYSEMSNYVGVRIILEDRFHDNKNRGVIAIRTSFGK